MKKWMMICAVVFGMSLAASAGVWETALLWLPNRMLDVTDIVSLGIGFGGIKAEARVTRALDFSAGEGFYLMARKDYHRQIGFSLEQGYHVNFVYIGMEDYGIDAISPGCFGSFFPLDGVYADSTLQRCGFAYKGWLCPCEEDYDFRKGARDWWEIALEAGAGVAARVAVHPIEIADFICGIFCYDLTQDDIVLE